MKHNSQLLQMLNQCMYCCFDVNIVVICYIMRMMQCTYIIIMYVDSAHACTCLLFDNVAHMASKRRIIVCTYLEIYN